MKCPGHKFRKIFNFYYEKTAGIKNNVTERNFSGTARYVPISGVNGGRIEDKYIVVEGKRIKPDKRFSPMYIRLYG